MNDDNDENYFIFFFLILFHKFDFFFALLLFVRSQLDISVARIHTRRHIDLLRLIILCIHSFRQKKKIKNNCLIILKHEEI